MRRSDLRKDLGMGEKPHDMYTVPLCNWDHVSGPKAQHKMSERVFWFELHKIDPFAIALRLWHESGGEYRSHLPRAPAKAKPIAPRKAASSRMKIKSRPEIKSAGFRPPKPQLSASRAIQKRCGI
jgi:hypothetical protein